MTLHNMGKWLLLKDYFLDHWLGTSIFTQNANIMLWISDCLTFRTIVLRTNTATSHHVRAQQATPTTININGWQARYLCLSVPINIWQTRHDLDWTLQPTSCSTSGGVRKTSSFLFLESMMRRGSSSLEDDSIFPCQSFWLLSHVIVANSYCNFWPGHFVSKHFAPSEQ